MHKRAQNVVIIGASSAIAMALARAIAKRGGSLYLVARDLEKLQRQQQDLLLRGAVAVHQFQLDVNDLDRQVLLLHDIQSRFTVLDVFILAHGSLPDQTACEKSVSDTLQALQTNLVSSIALLTRIAPVFAAQRQGTIAVISSVAGDRGRSSNYVYGAAKAGLSVFVQGLGQRLAKSKVVVTLLKPGFVATPMTRSFVKGPLWITAESAAKLILRAIDSEKSLAYVPKFWWCIMLVIKLIPEALFRRMRL